MTPARQLITRAVERAGNRLALARELAMGTCQAAVVYLLHRQHLALEVRALARRLEGEDESREPHTSATTGSSSTPA